MEQREIKGRGIPSPRRTARTGREEKQRETERNRGMEKQTSREQI